MRILQPGRLHDDQKRYSPHQDAIIQAYLMAFGQWGIPKKLRIDNGKDFASRLLTGFTKADRDRLRRHHGADWQRVIQRDENLVECSDTRFLGITHELGVETIFAIPYAPWSKAATERWYGTFEGRCGKTFATYCGNSTVNRPECLEDIKRGYSKPQMRDLKRRYGTDWKRVAALRFVDKSDVPTLDQAREQIGEYIDEYHHTPHSSENMAGQTPMQVWDTAESVRRAGDDELLLMMELRGVYKYARTVWRSAWVAQCSSMARAARACTGSPVATCLSPRTRTT